MSLPRPTPPSGVIEKGRSQPSLAGLPESYDVHWTAARKARVARAVRDHLISFDEVRRRYLVSRTEFESWKGLLRKREAEPTMA